MVLCHAGLWQVLRSLNIREGLVQPIQALYVNSSNAVLLNSQLGGFFKTTIEVRQERLLSSTLLNLFLERIVQETLHDHHTSISIGGRPVCNLRFSDDSKQDQLTPLWIHMNVFWQLSGDGNLHGWGMSHATTASPKPFFRAPCRVGDALVDRGNAAWTTSKSGHPCPCQNCSQWPLPEKTG